MECEEGDLSSPFEKTILDRFRRLVIAIILHVIDHQACNCVLRTQKALGRDDGECISAKEKIRAARYVQKAALQFCDAGGRADNKLSDEAREAGFGIDTDELASVVHGHDNKRLEFNGGVEGIARKVCVSLNDGIHECDKPIRQKIYGINRHTEKPHSTYLTFLWDALQDWTLIRLMTLAVLSMCAGLATEGWPECMYDGFRIMLSVFMVAIITATRGYKQSLQFRDLDREKKKKFIQVTRDGQRQDISIYDLVVGDIVHLSIGDQVPADGLFISGHSLLIDESGLSGESEPVNIYKENPFLLSGTKVQEGSGKMLVTAVGLSTEWGKLVGALNDGGEDESPLQVKLNGVAKIIGKIGLTFEVITFLVLTGRFIVEKSICSKLTDWSLADALTLIDYLAVSESPSLAVTLSLAFAMKKLMNDLALVRYLSACETMGSANCICSDKTGTLTTNQMVVDKIWICHNITKIEGNKYKDILPGRVSNILLQTLFQNSNSVVVKDKEGKNVVLGSPTESAILKFGLLLGGDFEAQRREFKMIKVEPFNSTRKKMSVLVALPDGRIRAFCKGASEIVLGMCDKVVDDSGEHVSLSEEQKRHVSDVIDGFASEALRTLCLAFKDLGNSSDENNIPDSGYTLIAVIGIKNPVRPGVKEAVQTCLAAGITVRMVTGDNINTAKAMAKECGILTSDGEAIKGPELRNMSFDEMKRIIPKLQVMAHSSPMDKHILVTQLRNTFREVVAVTGNGINDAPALREADIGLAMGIAGTEVAKENADVIILDDNFSTIVNVVKWGRAVYINMQKFVQFLLTVNAVALMIDLVTACISGTASLTDVQLLWVDIIVETLGALALATEPPNDGLMKRPPVGRGESFITNIMWRNIIGQSIHQLIVLGILNFYGKQLLGLSGADASQVLNTVIFNSFVFCQVFNEINSREMEKINVLRGIFNSWMFIGIIVITVAFQVMIVEFLGAFAGTVPLSWQLWVVSVLLGATSMPVAVIIKFIPV